MNVSYVCVSHIKGSCFNVFRSKGHPSQESMELMSILELMEEHIKSLHTEINYKDDTEIVLILSFASDDMIYMVNMFLEVFFMDVTCCTNHQNKPLFLMVLKDANGEGHIGNISVLPSEKCWVFNEIFQTVFTKFYGESMICCNCLMLTDEDSAEVEPIMNSIATIDAMDRIAKVTLKRNTWEK